jgi:hypothetical protein
MRVLSNINQEDKTVPFGWKALPQIENLVTQIVAKMGGSRLFISVPEHQEDWELWMPQSAHLLLGTLWYGCGYMCWWWLRHSQAVENAEDNAPKLGKI